MVIPVESNYVRTHYDVFRNDLLSNPRILAVSSSQAVPADREYSDSGWETEAKDDLFLSMFFAVDYDFFDTYKLEMVAGRPFSRDFQNDHFTKFIINETASRKLGFATPEEALNKKYFVDWLIENREGATDGEIIGVVKDFHFKSMRNQIEPLTLFVADHDWMGKISIRYEEGYDKEVKEFVEQTWYTHFKDINFDYSYISEYLNRYYVDEVKMKKLLIAFAVLAIVIACLGLFGLATFMAGRKTKEIGIRKVFGASVSNVMYIVSRNSIPRRYQHYNLSCSRFSGVDCCLNNSDIQGLSGSPVQSCGCYSV